MVKIKASDVPRLNIVPWVIIGQAAYYEQIMIQHSEHTEEHQKYRIRYDAMKDLARQLHPWH